MIKTLLLAISLAALLAGCTSAHYTRSNSQMVTLFLKMPTAGKVQFASSLDNYRIHDTRKKASGRWEVLVPKNAKFSYFYIVDGRNYVPDCRYKETDDFGSQNCIYLP